MKRRRRILPAGLAAMVLVAIMASPVAGCLTTYGPTEHFERSDVVVTGVAVDRHAGNPFEALLMLLGRYVPADVAYDIAVDRIEKGESRIRIPERVTLHLEGITSCAQELQMGHRYRIGATDRGPALAVSFGAFEELPLLPGAQPAVATSGEAVRVTAMDLLPILQVLLVLVLVIAGLRLAWARFRHAIGRANG
jgi:hypothetical protein